MTSLIFGLIYYSVLRHFLSDARLGSESGNSISHLFRAWRLDVGSVMGARVVTIRPVLKGIPSASVLLTGKPQNFLIKL